MRPVALVPREVRPPSPSLFTGVGQPDSDEVEALADVRRTDARSAQISSPEGVARAFQVSAYSVEPREAVRARNLLSKDDWRAALVNELEPGGPEVALVGSAFASPGDGEGLAGAGAGPDGSVVGPAGKAEGVAPDSDACEEMRLSRCSHVFTGHLENAARIDAPLGDVPGVGEVLQPLRRVGVELVVVRRHQNPHVALATSFCTLPTPEPWMYAESSRAVSMASLNGPVCRYTSTVTSSSNCP